MGDAHGDDVVGIALDLHQRQDALLGRRAQRDALPAANLLDIDSVVDIARVVGAGGLAGLDDLAGAGELAGGV